MTRSKKQARKQSLSTSDVDKTFRRIQSQFNISLYLDRMSDSERKKHDEMWRRTKPKRYSDLTEAEQKAYDKSQAELYREEKQARPYNEMRELLQIGINIKSDDPNSELFRTAKELLDVVDRVETEPSSVSKCERRKFRTALGRYQVLLKAELKAEQEHPDRAAETVPDTTPAKRWWIPTCLGKIIEKGLYIFTKSFWDAFWERVWPK